MVWQEGTDGQVFGLAGCVKVQMARCLWFGRKVKMARCLWFGRLCKGTDGKVSVVWQVV